MPYIPLSYVPLKLLPLAALLLGFFAVLPVIAPSLSGSTSAESLNSAASGADPAFASIRICRAGVEPCQREVNLPVGGEVDLELFLVAAPDWDLPGTHLVVAWESHIRMVGGVAVDLLTVGADGDPVQEQGNPRLALNGLTRLAPGMSPDSLESSRLYYGTQNRYDPATGQLDYSVTRAGFSANNPGTYRPITGNPNITNNPMTGTGEIDRPFTRGSRLMLGKITVRGAAVGRALLFGVNSDTDKAAIRVVTYAYSGRDSGTMMRRMVPVSDGPLASVNVGPSAETVRIRGQAWLPAPVGIERRTAFDRELTLTFWKPGEVPSWQGGSAFPLVTFFNLDSDASGRFIAKDLPADLIPSGVYDLRLKGAGVLSRRVSGVNVEQGRRLAGTITGTIATNPGRPPPGLPVALDVNFGVLRGGDCNGDNAVNDADIAVLDSRFGKAVEDSELRLLVDFNGDNVVDGQDFSLLAANIGRTGE